jgi:ribosomal protein L37AE/L43A
VEEFGVRSGHLVKRRRRTPRTTTRDRSALPECGNLDRVITNRLAAELWYRRNAYMAEELEALADAPADGLVLNSDVPPRTQ